MAKAASSRLSLWTALLGKLGLSATPKSGDAFRLGDVTGVVDLVSDKHEIGLVVREYDDALLRFTLMGKANGDSTFVYGYVIAYGAQRERASELIAAGNRAVEV
jgi:hypothetical protein